MAIFGPTHPVLGFAPRGLFDRVIEVDEYCRPCSLHGRKECFREERYCFENISVESVVESAVEMIDQFDRTARAVFVDRDGTIIVDKDYLRDPERVELLEGSVAGLRSLQDQGFKSWGDAGIPGARGNNRGMDVLGDHRDWIICREW